MVFKAVFADVVEQFLHVRNLDDPGSAKCFQRVVGEAPVSDIAAYLARKIVGGKTREGHGSGLHTPDARAKSVLFTDSSSNDGLEIHLHILEKMLGQVAAVKTNRFVGIAAVIVVPVEERTWRARGQLQNVHAEHTAHIHFAGAGEQRVTHHAHYRARYDS